MQVEKAFYDLKEFLRAWFDRLRLLMKGLRYHQGNYCHTLFVKRSATKVVILIVYVDDDGHM